MDEPTPAAEPERVEPGRPRTRVAVVADDDPAIRTLLGELLRHEMGYDVVPVGDGEAALAALQATVPDVALLDHRMPKLDGFQVARRLRADPRTRDVRIVCISAHADAEAALAAGCSVFVSKPFDIDGVVDAIRRAAGRP